MTIVVRNHVDYYYSFRVFHISDGFSLEFEWQQVSSITIIIIIIIIIIILVLFGFLFL